MAVWSIIKKSETEGSTRMDAEYYQPKYLFIDSNIRKYSFGYKSLKEIGAKVVSGPFGSSLKSESYLNEGVPFIRISDLHHFFIRKDNLVYISELDNQRLHSSQLQEGDLVLSKVGNTIGVVSIITNDIERANISENNIGIKLQGLGYGVKIFLLTFLNSKLGQEQILRRISGNAQPKLNIADIYEINFYNPTENVLQIVENLVVNAKKCVDDSNTFYSQAEQILIEELGLKDLDLKDGLFYTTTLKEVKDNNRMDTEYYMSKYEKLMEHIYNFEHIPLGKLAKFKKGVEPGSDKYFKTGKPFLRVSNLSKFEIINNNQKHLENKLYMQLKKSYEPKKGEILLSKDATPGVAYVLKESIEGIISSGILRLEIAPSIKNEYLALVINSQVGQMQMKRDSSGSIINHWKIDQIINLEIPLLTHDAQKKIENLCCESFLKRKEAKQLLEHAKHKVEEMIEKEAGVK